MHTRTKIVVSIGPASGSEEMLQKLAEAGMNVCRLNFSHGTHEEHAEYIRRIRAVSEKLLYPLTILQDLQGPKIRVANLPAEGRLLEEGKEIILTTDIKDKERIAIDSARVHEVVKAGERILFDDGLMDVEVTRVEGRAMFCRVLHGGTLLPHKGVNFPQTKLIISSLTDKDRIDLRFGIEQGVDWIALSFVRSAENIREVRELMHVYEEELDLPHDPPIRIMAKIEKAEAMMNLEEIIKEVDGIMVARGDLGVETAMEKVPMMQKQIIAACLRASKPVVVATQMLDSMIRHPRPTRAEISDVANAVIDHADGTMLSGETTVGKYPFEAVQTMVAAIREAEISSYDDVKTEVRSTQVTQEAMTNVASALAIATEAKAVIVASLSGRAARLVSRERPQVPIFAIVPSDRVGRQLGVSWGVFPLVVLPPATIKELITRAIDRVRETKILTEGDDIVMLAGEPLGESGMVNLVEIRKI